MRVVFVRHAIAEDGPDDVNRRLSDRGRERFGRSIEVLAGLLKKEKPYRLLTSPALRASQTAALIAQALPVAGVEVRDWIYTGELGALRQTLSESREDLIIVGHEPHLSLWSRAVCGFDVNYRKGGLAQFACETGQWQQARLLYAFRALTPEGNRVVTPSAGQAVRTDIGRALRKAARQAAAWEARFHKKPRLSRPPHQLRVSLRKARSLLSFLKPMPEASGLAPYRKELGELARAVADLRETDVLIGDWLDLVKRGQEGVKPRAFLKALRRTRDEEKDRALGRLTSPPHDEALRALEEYLKDWRLSEEGQGKADTFVMARYSRWLKGIERAWRALDPADAEQVHALRLRLKKYRNVQGSLGLPAIEKERHLPDLKATQALLGDLCDTHAGEKLLRSMAPKLEGGLRASMDLFLEDILRRRERLTTQLRQSVLETRQEERQP